MYKYFVACPVETVTLNLMTFHDYSLYAVRYNSITKRYQVFLGDSYLDLGGEDDYRDFFVTMK